MFECPESRPWIGAKREYIDRRDAGDGSHALEVADEPLPVEHGGPIRLVPTDDTDCWEGITWMSKIEVTEEMPVYHDTVRDIALSHISDPSG